jgi:hypothetical protein
MEIEMKVKGLVVDPISKMPIVVLENTQSEQILPIWIGVFEANAIALSIENIETPRPMTHDLLKTVLEKTGISVSRIVVTDVRNNTFYALIHCRRNDSAFSFDSRPSDAIALALRMSAPIYVEDQVVTKASAMHVERDRESSEEMRKWLEKLQPDDFGKYKM